MGVGDLVSYKNPWKRTCLPSRKLFNMLLMNLTTQSRNFPFATIPPFLRLKATYIIIMADLNIVSCAYPIKACSLELFIYIYYIYMYFFVFLFFLIKGKGNENFKNSSNKNELKKKKDVCLKKKIPLWTISWRLPWCDNKSMQLNSALSVMVWSCVFMNLLTWISWTLCKLNSITCENLTKLSISLFLTEIS